MRIKGSRIANSIDNEYRKNERYFRRKYCAHCKNSETNLCEIRYTIDHQLKCVYYEE